MKRFDITFFFGPTPEYVVKDKVIAEMAASGITLAQLNHDTAVNKAALPIMAKYGIRADVGDPRISKIYWENDTAAADATVKEVVADYAAFDNIEGFDICDEPHSECFETLAAIVAAFKKYAPDKETVINLYPNYASPEQLRDVDYVTHLRRFAEVVKPHFISYDHYHFLGRDKQVAAIDDTVDERERMIRESVLSLEDRDIFFENMEDVRRVGLDHDLEQMLIVLLIEHGPYRNLTYAEILWEVNICLAYGFHRLSYFTYWNPGEDPFWRWSNAMCNGDGSKCQHWYDVQDINGKIRPIGEVLFNTKSAGVFHVGTPEKGTTAFAGFGKLQAVSGGNAVVGCFEDGSYYIVNRDYQQPVTLTLTVDGDLTAFDGSTFTPCGTVIDLPAGGGILLK